MRTLASHRAQTQSGLLVVPDVQAPEIIAFLINVSLRKSLPGPHRRPTHRRLAGTPEPHAVKFIFAFGSRSSPHHSSVSVRRLPLVDRLSMSFVRPLLVSLTWQLLPLHLSSPLVVSSFPMSTSSSVAVPRLARLLSSSFVYCPRLFYSLNLSFSSWLRRLPLGYRLVSPLLRLSSSHRLFACLFDPA